MKIVEGFSKELHQWDIIGCLRHDIKDHGVTLKLEYNKPPGTMNQMMQDLYSKNIFTASRRVYYSKKNNKGLDMVLF